MQENLFLIEFMLTWPKTGRLRLFCLVSFRHSLELKSPLSWLSEFLLDGALMTSNTEGCSRPLLSAVSEHSLPSQNFFIFAKKFFATWLHPETFRCKPLRLSCLYFIFLLSMMLIFSCKRWFVKWETVWTSFPLFVRMVCADNQMSRPGLIRRLGFFRKIETMWWFPSFTVYPGPFPHNFSSISPFIIESPIIAVVPLDHSPLLLFWFLSHSLLLTLFLNL